MQTKPIMPYEYLWAVQSHCCSYLGQNGLDGHYSYAELERITTKGANEGWTDGISARKAANCINEKLNAQST